jgi:hypothetical protein
MASEQPGHPGRETKDPATAELDALRGAYDAIGKRLDALGNDGKRGGRRHDDDNSPMTTSEARALMALLKRHLDESDGEGEEESDDAETESEETEDGEAKDTDKPRQLASDSTKSEDKLMEVQHRFDSVAMSWGMRAPPPMMGESLLSYRRRMARKFQQHSERFKNSDLRTIKPGPTFDAIEKEILECAERAARSNDDGGSGMLRELKRNDQSGRAISEFYGNVSADNGALAPFRLPRMRVKIEKPPGQYW